ncbi:MAG: NAD(P)/FAD-dependent oxidoreductase [Zetaproteobacteria bacterium]|nr:MAG: NAD(P)/FAD-dependent oxidoreductase [Zetaproteobacteria bacterium]
MSRLHDVAVVGAGPAGAMTAWQLASHGVSVILLERKRIPRPKVCGGGLVWRARRMLPVQPDEVVLAECRQAALFVDGMRFAASRNQPLVSMVRRDAFDAWLCAQACAAGADLWQGFSVQAADFEADAICLRDGERRVRARLVVAADGAAGRMARLAGWPAHACAAPAVETEVAVDDETYARFAGVARFDFDVPLRGYGWVFPRDGRLNVGLGMLAGRMPRGGLRARLGEYLAGLGLPWADAHGFLIPLCARRPCARNGVFLVGDAAGLADPVTAEGISAALRSAQLLARAMVQADLNPSQTAAVYEQALGAELLREQRAAARLAKVWYASSRLRAWMLRKYGRRMCEGMADVFMGNGSYHAYAQSFLRRLHPGLTG